MNDKLNLSMFRAYDIRTPSALLTPELAQRLARAEASYFRDVLGVSRVLVAHDARSTGPHYLTIAADAFRRAGLEVIYLPGVCSTSYFYFAAMHHSDDAAVMFGASHNPAGDTGQKILGPGVTPIAEKIGPEGGLDKIKRLYVAGASSEETRQAPVRAVELLDEYVSYSMRLAGVERGSLAGTKVFQDYLFGASGREMMLALNRAGADLTPVHFVPDGTFPLGDPNPVKAEVIQSGLKTLDDGSFLFGMFFDGDGDRIDFYRGDGRYLSSSFLYAAILPEIGRRFPEPGMGVFADLKSNPVAIIEMAKAGATVDVIRNGHSQIKQSLADDPTRFGAVEESAHFYEAFHLDGPGRYCTENTLYIALLVTRMWQQDPARFDELFTLQSTTAREREWGYKFTTDTDRAEALEAVRELFEKQGLRSLQEMNNGMSLEATLMRRGLTFDVDQDTRLAADWLQICQRVSQSESGLARWEVVGANADIVHDAKTQIARCVAQFGAGTEYHG